MQPVLVGHVAGEQLEVVLGQQLAGEEAGPGEDRLPHPGAAAAAASTTAAAASAAAAASRPGRPRRRNRHGGQAHLDASLT